MLRENGSSGQGRKAKFSMDQFMFWFLLDKILFQNDAQGYTVVMKIEKMRNFLEKTKWQGFGITNYDIDFQFLYNKRATPHYKGMLDFAASDEENKIIVLRVEKELIDLYNKVIAEEAAMPVEEKSQIEPAIDLVAGRYIASDANTVWSIDETERKQFFLTTILDMASGLILGYFASKSNISTSEVVCLLTKTIRRFGPPQIIHTDQGGAFVSIGFQKFVSRLKIKRSITVYTYSNFRNQQHESWHKNLWYKLDCYRSNEEGLAAWEAMEYSIQLVLISLTIEYLNNKPVVRFRSFSASQIFYAITKYPSRLYTITTVNSATVTEIENYKIYMAGVIRSGVDVVLASSGAINFPWMPERLDQTMDPNSPLTVGYFQHVIHSVLLMISNLASFIQNEAKVNTALILAAQAESDKKLNEIKVMLEEEKAKNKLLSDAILAKNERRRKRANAQRRIIRQPLNERAFRIALDLCENPDSKIKARDRVVLTFLYLTGTRIGNLLSITYGQMDSFFSGENTVIEGMKRATPSYHSLVAVSEAKPYIDLIRADWELLKIDKADTDIVVNVARETITRKINLILKKLSSQIHRHIRSHSFRITMATDISREGGIEAAREILDHVSTTTTRGYLRGNPTAIADRNAMRRVIKERLRSVGNDPGSDAEEGGSPPRKRRPTKFRIRKRP